MEKLKRIGKVILVVVSLLASIYFFGKWYFFNYYQLPEGVFDASIDQVRKIALSEGQPGPVAVRRFPVASGEFPGIFMMAGDWENSYEMVFPAFELLYHDSSTVFIDAVNDLESQPDFDFGIKYDTIMYHLMQRQLKNAEVIVITHEHFDHMTGIRASPYFDSIVDHLRLTGEQMSGSAFRDNKFTSEQVSVINPITYDMYQWIAPGVVLIKAPGHTPGSQMIYVAMLDGRELLFIGDIAWNFINIERQRDHAKLGALLGGEDLEAKGKQLKWLNQIAAETEIEIIVAHDAVQHRRLINIGVFSDFSTTTQ